MNSGIDEARLDEARRFLATGQPIPPELGLALLDEIEALRDKVIHAETMENSYIEEIQRMNNLVNDLASYVETMGDAVSDSLGTNGIAAELRRRVVEMILRSSKSVKESH